MNELWSAGRDAARPPPPTHSSPASESCNSLTSTALPPRTCRARLPWRRSLAFLDPMVNAVYITRVFRPSQDAHSFGGGVLASSVLNRLLSGCRDESRNLWGVDSRFVQRYNKEQIHNSKRGAICMDVLTCRRRGGRRGRRDEGSGKVGVPRGRREGGEGSPLSLPHMKAEQTLHQPG